jgi:prolipoprotein diacylglyceryl transferase
MGFLAVIIGARLGHCLFYEPEVYLKDPIRILYFWQGGLASHGSTIALIGVLIYFAFKEKMAILEVFDRFSFAAAWGAALVRGGNFMNSEIVGRTTDASIGVKFPRYEFLHNGAQRVLCAAESCAGSGDSCAIVNKVCLSLENVPWRHASQLYELGMGAVVFIVLLVIDKVWGEERPLGLLGFTFLLLYFTGRFTVEFFKEYQALGANDSMFTMGQYLSVPFMIIGLLGVISSLSKHKKAQLAA